MNRLIVALLAAFDAVIAAAGGLALALAPLTLLWVVGLGPGADWPSLWPASAAVWQVGHFVPVDVTLPAEYLAVTGIDAAAATFTISLAPLLFALFTAAFAARSGGRAAAAGTPATGVVAGSLVFAGITVAVALTSAASLLTVQTWQAILLPVLVFAVPSLLGAVVGAWREDVAPIAGLRARVEQLPDAWGAVPGLIVRGTAVAVAGLVGVGALVLGIAILAGGGRIVALYEAGNVDVVGASVLTVAQAFYLPTLIVWALSFAAGPGFALGTDTAVSPSGTQLGVLPGVPVLGAVPDSTSTWLLLLVLLPVGVGVLTGFLLRSRLAAHPAGDEAYGPRAAVLGGVTVLTAALVGLFAACASGAFGPGRLAEIGPQPGAVALAVGIEVLVGAGILLLAPRRAEDRLPDWSAAERPEPVLALAGAAAAGTAASAGYAFPADEPDEAAEVPSVAGTGPVTAAAFASPDDPWGFGARSATPVAEDPDATGPLEPLDAAADDATDPADQPTEPLIGFERGSGAARRPEADPDSSLD